MSSEGVEKLLNQLGESGHTDSQGSFTISIEKALEKLAHFQLANPRDYVLHGVASAVAGGASYAHFTVSSSQSELRFDGEAFSAEDLQALFLQVLQPSDPRLEEMGVAVSAAMNLKPQALLLASWNGDEGVALRWSNGSWSLGSFESEESDLPHHRLLVVEGLSIRRASEVQFGTTRERSVLTTHARWAPLDLQYNGRQISQALKWNLSSPTFAGWSHLNPGRARLRVQPPEQSLHPHGVVLRLPDSTANIEAVLSIDSQEQSWTNGLWVQSRGLAYRRDLPTGNPFVSAVVSGVFRSNVSHSDIAEDKYYRDLLERLDARADCLVADRLSHEALLPEPFRSQVLAWAPQLEARLRLRGDDGRAQAVKRWIKEREFISDLRNDRAWKEMHDQLSSLTGEAKPKEVERLASVLAGSAEESLAAQQLLDCQFLCDRIYRVGQLTQPPWLDTVGRALWLLAALNGAAQTDIPNAPGEIRTTLFRMIGKPADALPHSHSPLGRVEILLALRRFPEALATFEAFEYDDPFLMEGHLECLKIAGGPEGRARVLPLHIEVVERRSRGLDSLGGFLLQDLCRTARSHGSIKEFASQWMLAHGNGLPGGPLSTVSTDFESVEKALRKGKKHALVDLHTCLLWAEKNMGPASPYLQVTRSRAVSLLRHYDFWEEADVVLTRGRVLEQVRATLRDLQYRSGEPEA